MIEKHPFGAFVPKHTKYLLLGSSVGKESTYPNQSYSDPESWFYTTKRNQFWTIIENVFDISLPTRRDKEKLFNRLGIAIADVILRCKRKNNSNLDNNLVNKTYNTKVISKIFKQKGLSRVYFSSRAVETEFKRYFKEILQNCKEIEFITLPSPSPRYAKMTKEQKVKRYKELFQGRQIRDFAFFASLGERD